MMESSRNGDETIGGFRSEEGEDPTEQLIPAMSDGSALKRSS